MNFCVAIELSKKSISFLYYRSDSAEQRFKHFDGLDPVLPLAIYCKDNDMEIGKWAHDEALRGNPNAYTDVYSNNGTYKFRGKTCPMNTLVYNAILVKLEYFFNKILLGVENQLEQNVATMPICIVLDSDLSENESLLVTKSFLKGGFGNVGIYNYNQIVVDVSNISTLYALCMKSDGVDLNVSLYDKNGRILGSDSVKGVGADPRVGLAAKLMWESAGYDTYYLDRDIEMPYLVRAAEDFINSGNTEFNGNVELSKGNSIGCFISRHQLDSYNYAENHLLKESVIKFLNALHIPTSQCTLFLMGKAAGNVYFKDVFSLSFADTRDVGGAFSSEVFSKLLNDVISDHFRLQPIGQAVSTTSDPWPGETVPIQANAPTSALSAKVSPVITESEGVSQSAGKTIADQSQLTLKGRRMLAEIRGDVRDGRLDKARQGLDALENMMKEEGCNTYDIAIKDLRQSLGATLRVENYRQPVSIDHRRVRVMIADIKGCLSSGNVGKAENKLNELRQMLAQAHCNEYDDRIAEFEKSIKAEPQKPPLSLFSVRKLVADIMGSLRSNNMEVAQEKLSSLENAVMGNSNKLIVAAVNKVKELVEKASPNNSGEKTVEKQIHAKKAKEGDEGYSLIKRGDFAQAKRLFVESHDDKMVKTCVELISANGVIRMAQSRLPIMQQKKDQKQIKRIVADLSKSAVLFRKNGVPTENIDNLLASYKKIK